MYNYVCKSKFGELSIYDAQCINKNINLIIINLIIKMYEFLFKQFIVINFAYQADYFKNQKNCIYYVEIYN